MLLACFGDSITEGYMVRREEAWPYRLSEFSRTDGGVEIDTLNFGVSGDTSFDGLRRCEQVLDSAPNGVFLEFGINDFFNAMPLEAVVENLETMIRLFLDHSIKVYLAGFSFPGHGSSKWEAAYHDLASRLDIRLYPDIFSSIRGRSGCFLADGLHPSGHGYGIMAQDILAFLRKCEDGSTRRPG